MIHEVLTLVCPWIGVDDACSPPIMVCQAPRMEILVSTDERTIDERLTLSISLMNIDANIMLYYSA